MTTPRRKFALTQVVGENLVPGEEQPTLELLDREQIIGRSERADFELPVPTVSRQHAAVWMADDVPYIRDLTSGHGTYVNSTRITEPTALRQGDLLSLGEDAVFLVSAIETAEIEGLAKAQLADEGSVDSSLVELALTDTASEDRYKAYLERLPELSKRVLESSSEEELLEAVVEELGEIIACDRFLALSGDVPQTLRVVSRKLRRPDDAAHWQPPSSGILKRAMLSDKPVISFDAQTDKRFKERQSIAMSNVRSAICVALRSSEGALGVLYADTLATKGLHSMSDGEFMALVGRCVGSRIREMRLQDELVDAKSYLDDSDVPAGALAGDIKSHLNRLEMIADDTEVEKEQPAIARLLRAECDKLRSDVDRYICWAKQETTSPGADSVDEEILPEDEDAQDRAELPPKPRKGGTLKQ